MQRVKIPPLYKKYFIDKSDERVMLFKIINSAYSPQKGLYPGSFVHITPSFFIKDMTYIDSDKRVGSFFSDESLLDFIEENKEYSDKPIIKCFQEDYSNELPIEKNSFDIMFSFYAGFISQSCKKYLNDNGILICNNSHGDASIAFTDSDYSLIGVIMRNGDKFRIVDNNPELYFRKKDGSPIDRDKVLKRMTGENFTKNGYAYIFRYQSFLKDDI